MQAKTKKIKELVLISIFICIEIIFAFTPLGSIPIGTGIVATLAHIPVIIAALLLGYRGGLILGGTMGICSLIWWSFNGVGLPSAFAFTPFSQFGNGFSVIICLLPRLLFPVFTVLIFKLLSKKINQSVSASISGVVSTFLHSAMVLSLIYVCFAHNSKVSDLLGTGFVDFIIAWAGINAIMEMIVAGVISGILFLAVSKRYKSTLS